MLTLTVDSSGLFGSRLTMFPDTQTTYISYQKVFHNTIKQYKYSHAQFHDSFSLIRLAVVGSNNGGREGLQERRSREEKVPPRGKLR